MNRNHTRLFLGALVPAVLALGACGTQEPPAAKLPAETVSYYKDVEPILAVLCGKTLELARMEVLEEEELRVMRS